MSEVAKNCLTRMRMEVAEVIDVGVAKGTPFLYESFPDADFVLIDPQKAGEALLEAFPAKYKYLNIGVSDAPGHLTLNENKALSSFLERTPLTAVDVVDQYTVEVRTLDDVIETETKSSSIGIKVDTEGFEGQVVAGLNTCVERVKFVILEASILRRFHGSANFSELVAMMKDRGFHFFNILNESRRLPPRFYDIIFLRKDDPLFLG